MALNTRTGNLFTSEHQTLVNTVNCVGVMGAGVAYEFRLRYPAMYDRYSTLCAEKRLEVGKLWLYKSDDSRWVLNFPTKKHWRNPSKVEYLEAGLANFVETYEQRGITSAAFPLLGASHGGIDPEQSMSIMAHRLSACAIPIDIYRYDASASDDLFPEFRDRLLSSDRDELIEGIGLRGNLVDNLRRAAGKSSIVTISQLISEKGIGPVSLEKTFRFLMNVDRISEPEQHSLSLSFPPT